jgi:hypothetical protein
MVRAYSCTCQQRAGIVLDHTHFTFRNIRSSTQTRAVIELLAIPAEASGLRDRLQTGGSEVVASQGVCTIHWMPILGP